MTLALQRSRWTYRFRSYINRRNHCGEKDDFSFSNVLEDMILGALLDPSVTLDALEDTLHTLVTMYVAEKEKSKKAGTAICVAPKRLSPEHLFWDNPLVYNVHTLNIGRYHIQASLNQQKTVNSSDANIYAATLDGRTNRKRKLLDEVSGDVVASLHSVELDAKRFIQAERCKNYMEAILEARGNKNTF